MSGGRYRRDCSRLGDPEENIPGQEIDPGGHKGFVIVPGTIVTNPSCIGLPAGPPISSFCYLNFPPVFIVHVCTAD